MTVDFPNSPRTIIQFEGVTGSGTVRYDSWEQKQLIKSVDVSLVTNETSEATIKFFDPNYNIIDTFAPALAKVRVLIYFGYGNNLGEPVFKGILGQIERGESETTFHIFDMAYQMKLEKRAGYKNQRSDLAIIKELVERPGYGLTFQGPSTERHLEPHKAATQDMQTDWEWMTERAKDSGLIYYVRQDTVFCKYPATLSHPSLILTNRKDFRLLTGWDFTYKTPEHADGKPKIVKHRRRGKGGKRVEDESDNSAIQQAIHVVGKRDHSNPTKGKMKLRAQAQKDLQREHAFTGHLETFMPLNGSRLDVRNTITINKIGTLFSGDYLCDKVNYKFSAGKLSLALDLYRDKDEAVVVHPTAPPPPSPRRTR